MVVVAPSKLALWVAKAKALYASLNTARFLARSTDINMWGKVKVAMSPNTAMLTNNSVKVNAFFTEAFWVDTGLIPFFFMKVSDESTKNTINVSGEPSFSLIDLIELADLLQTHSN